MKRLISGILAVSLVIGLAGCGGGGKPETGAKAMGRYIETPVVEGMNGANIAFDLHPTENGAELYVGGFANDPDKLIHQTVGSDGKLSEVEVSWGRSLAEMQLSLVGIAKSKDGEVYLLGRNAEQAQIFRSSMQNQELEPIEILDWPQEAGGGNTVMWGPAGVMEDSATTTSEQGEQLRNAVPNFILAADNGFLLIYNNQIEYRDTAGTKTKTFDGFFYLSAQDVCVQGNTLYVKNNQTNMIQVYDLTTGKVTTEHTYEKSMGIPLLFTDEENVYMVSDSGIYRQSDDGTLWEKLVDGELTSLSTPSNYIAAATTDGTDGFYIILSGVNGLSMMHYTYSADTPSQPDTELTIFSLNDHHILRQAISEFQRKNPEVKVNLKIGLDRNDPSANVEDVVRTLNTEILNGNGPDLIVLDGLPATSYIEKGVLTDLNSLVEKLKGTIAENMMAGYQKDEKTFAIPAQFTVPVFLSNGNADDITSMPALIEKTKSESGNTPPYLLAPDNLRDEQGKFMMDWFDYIGMELIQDNTLNTDVLRDFFANIKELYDTLLSYTPEGDGMTSVVASLAGGSSGFETLDQGPNKLENGQGNAYAMTLTGQGNLRNLLTLAQNGSWKLTSLFNTNKFTPMVNVGILESSGQKDLAESFLATLYGFSIQSVYLGSGFPVNSDALKEVVDEKLSDESASLYPMGQSFYDLCMSVDTPILLDATVRAAVASQAKAVLDGTITPEQAAQKVNDTVKIYLAE